MFNCLFNLFCPCHRQPENNCGRQCGRQGSTCQRGLNYRAVAYVNLQPTSGDLLANYGPSTVNFEAPPTSVPYVYQYEGTRRDYQRNQLFGCNQTCANFYVLNDLC